jgi:hypothetical protein
MRTMQLIEAAVAGKGSLDNARTVAVSRGWTPELFARKVRELSHTAKVAKPGLRLVTAAKAAPKPPRWNITDTPFAKARTIPVAITGPVEQSMQAKLVLTHERVSTRADGQVFRGVLAELSVGAMTYPLRLSEAALERLASKALTIFVGEKAHSIVRAG